jgi:hypothetical protein
MKDESISLHPHSSSSADRDHSDPLSNCKPRKLTRLFSEIECVDGVIIYLLKTFKVGKSCKSRRFYVIERVSQPEHWTSPFEGDVIGLSGHCFRDRWDCEDDFTCLQRAVERAEKRFTLHPVPTPRSNEEVRCLDLCLPREAPKKIPRVKHLV